MLCEVGQPIKVGPSYTWWASDKRCISGVNTDSSSQVRDENKKRQYSELAKILGSWFGVTSNNADSTKSQLWAQTGHAQRRKSRHCSIFEAADLSLYSSGEPRQVRAGNDTRLTLGCHRPRGKLREALVCLKQTWSKNVNVNRQSLKETFQHLYIPGQSLHELSINVGFFASNFFN